MGFRQYLIKHFGLPLTYAYATLRQSVAGNLKFRGIVFCNLDTSKTVISIKQSFQISSPRSKLRPHIFPHMVTPTMFSWDKIWWRRQKSLPRQCINSLVSHKLSHDRQFWFFLGGAYGSLPDAAIWWCLRMGGGGVLEPVTQCNGIRYLKGRDEVRVCGQKKEGESKAGVKDNVLVSFIHSYTGFRVFTNAFFEEVRFPLEAYHFHPFERVAYC